MNYSHALIIDDDAYNVYIMERFLDRENIAYTAITDTLMLENTLKELKRIDLVLLDLEMPKRDGYQIVEVLRRYLDGPDKQQARPRPSTKAPLARPRLVETPPAPAPVPAAPVRPDLAGFAQEVRRHADARAQGWSGDRKAYISHVWHLVRERRPEWGLSEIEFKCMLVEAHRAGSLVLANADLKDSSNIAQVQESAVVYKNAVFHFIRVDG